MVDPLLSYEAEWRSVRDTEREEALWDRVYEHLHGTDRGPLPGPRALQGLDPEFLVTAARLSAHAGGVAVLARSSSLLGGFACACPAVLRTWWDEGSDVGRHGGVVQVAQAARMWPLVTSAELPSPSAIDGAQLEALGLLLWSAESAAMTDALRAWLHSALGAYSKMLERIARRAARG